MKKILVCGAGGFIGSHLVEKLKQQGHYVTGVDLKHSEFLTSSADEFIIGDLTLQSVVDRVITAELDEVYQLAADMGGAGYVFTGNHDADIMYNSAMINLNIAKAMVAKKVKKVFFSSSACIYPQENQRSSIVFDLSEDSAYPANPDSEYGWEKIFSERVWQNFAKNHGLDIRIARFHNVFGPYGSWRGGREKSPAALCRKIATDPIVEIWGDGNQTRSFLYIDECITGIFKLMESNYTHPINIGSSRLLSINNLAELIATIAGKTITPIHIDGPVGVQGRCSDNRLIKQVLSWEPEDNLEYGLSVTYKWIENELKHA